MVNRWAMRHSEFWGLVDEVLGVRGQSLTHDFVLQECGGVTAVAALESGQSPKNVWFALCEAADVPPQLWWGQPVRPRRP